MDDIAVGRLVRLARVKRGMRQADVAVAAGVSRTTVSRLETGNFGRIALGELRKVCAVLGIRVQVELLGEGASLDRMADEAHAAMHEAAAALLGELDGWTFVPEVTFSVYGERGSIDILAWHEESRSLLVIELKTELANLQDTVATLDRKVRLAMSIARERGWEPATVSSWMLVAEARSNRRRVAAHAGMLRARYPSDGHAMRSWLLRPGGSIHALSFLSNALRAGTSRRLAPARRVRRPRTAASPTPAAA